MTFPAITTAKLTKEFNGYRVLDEVDLNVPEGAIYGFIGANGAGKTTTIRILLGLISATSGKVRVLGHNRGRLPAQPIEGVAFLPDVPSIDGWMTAMDAMLTFAKLSGVEHEVATSRAHSLLKLVGLEHNSARFSAYSRGMKQRLGIAVALVGSPRLLILDEPTSALDPIGRADLLQIIASLQGKTTVLFSSHLLSEVQQVCTHVGLLDRGKLLAQGPIDDVVTSVPRRLASLRVTGESDAIADARKFLAGRRGLDVVEETGSLQDVYEYLTGRGNR